MSNFYLLKLNYNFDIFFFYNYSRYMYDISDDIRHHL